MMHTSHQIPASQGEPLNAGLFTIFAIACVLVVSVALFTT